MRTRAFSNPLSIFPGLHRSESPGFENGDRGVCFGLCLVLRYRVSSARKNAKIDAAKGRNMSRKEPFFGTRMRIARTRESTKMKQVNIRCPSSIKKYRKAIGSATIKCRLRISLSTFLCKFMSGLPGIRLIDLSHTIIPQISKNDKTIFPFFRIILS